MRLFSKIIRRLTSLWCKPIEVFCFHKVSDTYQPQYGSIGDWTQTEQFKLNILSLRKKYTFISLEEAYRHLLYDTFRIRNYAVLTSDDGYQCLLDILPWLEEQKIPITLFISTKYLDGKSHDPWFDAHWGDISAEQKADYLKSMYIQQTHLQLPELCSKNVSLSLHGYGHDEVSEMSKEEFASYVDKCCVPIQTHPRFMPFYAYTWGRHSEVTDRVLREKKIVSVFMDGYANIHFDGAIHRKCIDGMKL
ncbi:MAG: polysaccharide deacetylase family protein [Paludibacteraceae bacterium]|nr:polysaccharide deacetylase family protein [Paludibacteraceae bacterium]